MEARGEGFEFDAIEVDVFDGSAPGDGVPGKYVSVLIVGAYGGAGTQL